MVPTARVGVRSVLDIDPDLGAGIGQEDWVAARQVCKGLLVTVRAQQCELWPMAAERDKLVGLVVVSGMVCREIRLRDQHLLELLGPGDVLQLPVATYDPRLCDEVALTTLVDTELLALGRSFIAAAARWPTLLVALQQRLEGQRERLAEQALIVHVPRAEHRLLLMLWHLSQRWGTVTPDGIVLALPLSHDLLGQLVAARRPTTTLALSALGRERILTRLSNRSWLLTAAAQDLVRKIAATSEATAFLGGSLANALRLAAAS